MGWQEDYGAAQGYLESEDGGARPDRSWHPQANQSDAHWRGYGRADSAFWLQGQPRASQDYGQSAGPRSQPGGDPQAGSWQAGSWRSAPWQSGPSRPASSGPVPGGAPSPRKDGGRDWQAGVAVLLIFVGLGCGGGAWWLHTTRAEHAAAAVQPTAVALNQSARIRTRVVAAECAARKPSGDLYLRTAGAGRQARAREIAGRWGWDSVTGKCLPALAYTIATAGTAEGECTTVGYVSDNRGYDSHARPAAPLPERAGEAGPGC